MRNLLLSSVTLLLVPAVAIASPEFKPHTHTTPIELKPISSPSDIKLASVCFLGYGDCGDIGFGKGDENYQIDPKDQCLSEGYYENNCSSVQEPESYCPYDKSYIKGCKCRTDLVSCPAGQEGVGESCDGKYFSCNCLPSLVFCGENEIGEGASCGGRYESCSCGSSYMYSSSNCSYPRKLSGSSCGGKYTKCSCPEGVDAGSFGCAEYYPSPCSSVCKSANNDNCENRVDNNSELYGCMKYYSDCSSKCEIPYKDNCRNRTDVISECPDNATCSYFSDCSSKISSWTCNEGYKMSGNVCVEKGCEIGDIYYTDGKCLPAAKHDTNKTPLGVVVYVTDEGQHGQILSLWTVDANGNKSATNSVKMVWSTEAVDISGVKNASGRYTAKGDYNSCSNTEAILAQGDASTYPAAWAAHKYAPTAATAGKWCLPSAGIMSRVYSYQGVIQTSIKAVGGLEYQDCSTWTSTEQDEKYAWYACFTFSDGINVFGPKYQLGLSEPGALVRPVMEF